MRLSTIAIPIILSASLACSIGADAQEAEAGQSLKLIFSDIDPEEGELWVSVCTKAQLAELYSGGSIECDGSARFPAKEGAEVEFSELQPGIYAVTAFHDEDGNGELDFDTRGIPFEATGNARNASGSFGPPTFEQMQITIAPASEAAGELTYRVRMFRVGI